MMRCQFLGTAGWYPTGAQETSCVVLDSHGTNIVLDAGTGVRRLVDQDLADRRLDILLSHFHLDHLIGLSYLPTLDACDIHIWGPRRWLYGRSTYSLVRTVPSRPYFSGNTWEASVTFHELRPGELDINSLSVRFKHKTRHTDPSVAMRVNDQVTYSTDTAYDPSNANFGLNTELPIHEGWYQQNEDEYHFSAAEVMNVAAPARAHRLAITHVASKVSAHDTSQPPDQPADVFVPNDTDVSLL